MGEVVVDESQLETALEVEATNDGGVMNEAARRWFSGSQRHLEEAISQRAGTDPNVADDSEGRTGRQENGMQSILLSGQPPMWDESRKAWVFTYTHFASAWHEFGTQPHTIRADNGEMLAFPWPDAPDEVVAMFSPGGEEEVNRSDWDGWVYFKEVNHPGNPAIGFVRAGRAEAVDWLKSR